MKPNQFTSIVSLTLAIALSGVAIAGCSGGPQPVDQAYVQASTEKATQAREIFTSAQGDLTKVSPEDHTKLVKFFGSQSEVERIWDNMAHPKAGGPGADKQTSKQ